MQGILAGRESELVTEKSGFRGSIVSAWGVGRLLDELLHERAQHGGGLALQARGAVQWVSAGGNEERGRFRVGDCAPTSYSGKHGLGCPSRFAGVSHILEYIATMARQVPRGIPVLVWMTPGPKARDPAWRLMSCPNGEEPSSLMATLPLILHVSITLSYSRVYDRRRLQPLFQWICSYLSL